MDKILPLSVLVFNCIFWVNSLFALDYAPWFSRVFEFYPSFKYRFQSYHKVEEQKGQTEFSGHDHFCTAGLGLTFWENWNGQIALTGAQTSSHDYFHYNDIAFLLRYQLTDDVVGDWFSSVVGITLVSASEAAHTDIGEFLHGDINSEISLAFGKEYAPFNAWLFRQWALMGFAIADVGSPIVRFEAALETQYCDIWRNALHVRTLWGLGKDILFLGTFDGYGSIHHQSVDIGWKSKLSFPEFSFEGGVFYRVYARNCPKNAIQYLISVELPFSL